MRAPLRLLALTITTFLIASVLLTHYRSSDSLPNVDPNTWSSLHLHPTNWLPSFHSGTKATVEEQWRLKEELSPSDSSAHEISSGMTSGKTDVSGAGGSGEDTMSDAAKAKALQRLKDQYGDDEATRKGKSPMGGKEGGYAGGAYGLADVAESSSSAEGASSSSTSSTSSSSSSTSSATTTTSSATAHENATSATSSKSTITTAPTTLKTTTKSSSSSGIDSSSILDEFAYLEDITTGAQPTTDTFSYDHLNSQAFNTGFETHLAAATETSSASSSSTSMSMSSTSSKSHSTIASASTADAAAGRKSFAALSHSTSATTAEDANAEETGKPHAEMPKAKDLHGFDNLRDLGIE